MKKVKSPKGALAREKLKRAALQVLEDQGYHQMRVVDVMRQAQMATGLFYHYFDDLRSLTMEVLTDFLAVSQNVDVIEKDIEKGDWYTRIYAHNHLVVTSYAKRPGLMRCLFQLADEDVDFATLLHQQFLAQLNWLVALMPRLFPDTHFKRNQALLIVYALAGSGERLLRDYYVNQYDSMLSQSGLIVEEMTELLSVMFYRGLFAENPPQQQLDFMNNIDAMRKH